MNKVNLLGTLLVLTACTAARASAIDPTDDLHCGVLTLTLQKNADQRGASPVVKKGLYVLQSWYFSKVKQSRLAEGRAVVDAMKANPSQVASAAKACSDRAFSDAGFSRWSSLASTDYEQRSKR